MLSTQRVHFCRKKASKREEPFLMQTKGYIYIHKAICDILCSLFSVALNKSSSVVEGDQVVVTCKIHDRFNNHSHTLKMSADQETPQTSQGPAITETLSAMSEIDMKKTFQCRVEMGGTVRAKTSLTLQIQGKFGILIRSLNKKVPDFIIKEEG